MESLSRQLRVACSFFLRYYMRVMIAFLEGTTLFVGEKFAVVAVAGVGYKVFAGADAIAKMPSKGGSVKLWTHDHVREDAHELYGFLHYAELELFEMLIAISGIGPKGALGILGVAPVDTLKKAIAAGDTSYLTRVSGIGKKIAEKVILELKDKMAGRGIVVDAPELKTEADALDALVALGYSQREARDALAGAAGDATRLEDRVQSALRRMGGKK